MKNCTKHIDWQRTEKMKLGSSRSGVNRKTVNTWELGVRPNSSKLKCELGRSTRL